MIFWKLFYNWTLRSLELIPIGLGHSIWHWQSQIFNSRSLIYWKRIFLKSILFIIFHLSLVPIKVGKFGQFHAFIITANTIVTLKHCLIFSQTLRSTARFHIICFQMLFDLHQLICPGWFLLLVITARISWKSHLWLTTSVSISELFWFLMFTTLIIFSCFIYMYIKVLLLIYQAL